MTGFSLDKWNWSIYHKTKQKPTLKIFEDIKYLKQKTFYQNDQI